MKEIINFLKKYTDGKQNTEKVEISVLQLNRVIKALERLNFISLLNFINLTEEEKVTLLSAVDAESEDKE